MPDGLRRVQWMAAGALLTACAAATAWGADDEPAGKQKLKLLSPAEAAENGKDPYAVPDGTPEEIIDFIDQLRRQRKQFATRDDAIEHAIKVQRAIISAGDKILAQKTDIDTAYAAAEMKLEALALLASAGIEGAMDDALKAAAAMKKDSREEIAELAKEWYSGLRIMSAPRLKEEERQALVNETLAAIRASGFSRESIGAALQLGESLEQHPESKIAGDYYGDLAKLLAGSDNPGIRQVAEIIQANSRRLNLPGNAMEVTGTTLEGKKFDWEKYRGKVVLVDFWATWCGPCIAELPNVKANYERFHDQGFEVVGISLDDDRAQLTAFLEEEQIPWVTLFAPPKNGEPTQPPTAEYYGITSIPTAILVNREGKVVSLLARGENLTMLLEQLFATPAKTE